MRVEGMGFPRTAVCDAHKGIPLLSTARMVEFPRWLDPKKDPIYADP